MSNRGFSRFCNLIIVGCLHKKRLTKGGGGGGHPRTPPLDTLLHVHAIQVTVIVIFIGIFVSLSVL